MTDGHISSHMFPPLEQFTKDNLFQAELSISPMNSSPACVSFVEIKLWHSPVWDKQLGNSESPTKKHSCYLEGTEI